MSVGINDIDGGGNAFQFDEIGDRVSGVITTVERRQQTSFEDNKPLTWEDGSPRMLTFVEVQTDLRDDDDDEGLRTIYCKGGNFEIAEGSGLSAEKALAKAAKDAGLKSIDEGMKLTMAFSGRSKSSVRGYQPAKLFVAKLEQPVASVSMDDLLD